MLLRHTLMKNCSGTYWPLPGHWKAACPHRQGFIQPFNPFIQPAQMYQPTEGQQILPGEAKNP